MNDKDRKDLARYPLWFEDGERFEAVLRILFEHDPIGICTEDNSWRETEYSLEVNTILPRLDQAACVADVQRIVYEEFLRWFGSGSAKDAGRYHVIAADIWQGVLMR